MKYLNLENVNMTNNIYLNMLSKAKLQIDWRKGMLGMNSFALPDARNLESTFSMIYIHMKEKQFFCLLFTFFIFCS